MDGNLQLFLHAPTWSKAIQAVETNRSSEWLSDITAAAAAAEARGADAEAGRLRRHAEVLEVLKRAGVTAALEAATSRIDPAEPKDRGAWMALMRRVAVARPDELGELTQLHPWLLSRDTDETLHLIVGTTVDTGDLPTALTVELRRLLLRAFSRDGTQPVLESLPSGTISVATLEEGVQNALRNADNEEALLRKLILHQLVTGDAAAEALHSVGVLLLTRYRTTGRRTDLAFALLAYRTVYDQLRPSSGPTLADHVTANLAGAMSLWEQATGELTYRDEAIALFRQHLARAAPDDPLGWSSAVTLAGLLVAEAGRRDSEALLDETNAVLDGPLAGLASVNTEQHIIGLIHLASAELLRFEWSGRPERARTAAARAAEAISQLPASDPDQRRLASALSDMMLQTVIDHRDAALNDLVIKLAELAVDNAGRGAAGVDLLITRMQALLTRYATGGAVSDLRLAIAAGRAALAGARTSSIQTIKAHVGLGSALQSMFPVTGDIADLNAAVEHLRQAVAEQARPGKPPAVPAAVQNYGRALVERYQHTRQPCDLDEAIEVTAGLLDSTDPADPRRLGRAIPLAAALRVRYRDRGERRDLDDSIAVLRGSLVGAPLDPHARVFAASNLGLALRDRYMADGNEADAREAGAVLRSGVEQSLATAPHFEMILSNYLLVLAAVALRDRAERGLDDADVQRWMAETQREVLRRCRETGNVPAALAAVEPYTERPPPDAADELSDPTIPPDDPDALEDDPTPRSLIPARRRPIRIPEYLTLFVERARAANGRFLTSGDPSDLDEAVALWRACVRSPAFASMPRTDKPVIVQMFAAAAYDRAHAPGSSIATVDSLVEALTLLLTLTDDDTDRALVSYDLARAFMLRGTRSGDNTNAVRAFDIVAAALRVLNPGEIPWRRGLRLLAAYTVHHLQGDGSFPRALRSRVDQVTALITELGSAGDAPVWEVIRFQLLQIYHILGKHPDHRVEALAASSSIVDAALVGARRTGNAESLSRWSKLRRSLTDAIEDAELGAEHIEVSLPELLAETHDPDEARLRQSRLRILYDRLDPDDDYDDWFAVALALLVVLSRGGPDTLAERQDESLEVAERMERFAAAHGRSDHCSTALRRQRELYADRIHGVPADNFDRAVTAAERDVACHPSGSDEWVWSKAQLGFALSWRVSHGRPVIGDADQALRECREAVAALGDEPEPHLSAAVHYMYGGILGESGGGRRADQLEEAIAAYHTALRHQNPGDVDWANTHHHLGITYTQRIRGNHEENLGVALEHFTEELTVFTRERYAVDWAFAMVSRGNALSQARTADPLTSAAEAAAAFDAALEVFTCEGFPRHWARIRLSQGLLAMDADRVGGRAIDAEAALEHLNAALEVYDREHYPVEWARAHEFLSGAMILLAEDGDIDQLRSAAEHAEMSLSVPDLSPVTRAGRLMNLGAAQLTLSATDPQTRQSRHLMAVRALEEALSIFEANGLVTAVRDAAASLIVAYSEMEYWDRAAAVYATGIRAAERGYAEALLITSRNAESTAGARLTRLGVRALVHAGRPTDALLALERGRARWLGESIARDRADLDRLALDHHGLATGFREAASAVRQAETNERAADVQTGDEALREQAELARAALDDRIERIRSLPGYEGFLALPDFADVRKVVARGAALAYLLPGEDDGLALIAHHAVTGLFAVTAHVLPKLTTAAVTALLVDRSYLAAQASGSVSAVLGPILSELGGILAPVAAALRELEPTMVTLVACGGLGVLPVHAAPYRIAGRESCLLAEFPITFAPSARVLTPIDLETSPVLSGVGDPTGDLRYARTELIRIAQLFPTVDSERLLYGSAATREALLAQLPGATYLHLSCHGYYDMSRPLDSHLRLAGGDRLTLAELLAGNALKGFRLVVASACQTAINDVMSLPEEAVGLPAGFLRAGTAAVIGTLWPVADRPTALLMERFYTCHLIGDPDADDPVPMSPAHALRHAQLWLAGLTNAEIGGVVDRPFAHPYFWAPFVLAGR